MDPIISVIMPCYNQAQYMPEALQSLLDQDYPHWECIMVNDGSPDNTDEVARQWVKKDNRFKYFKKENSGVCDTRNYAAKQAIGEYIVSLDGDDRLGSHYFSEAIATFAKDSEVKLIYSDTILFGDKNENIINPPFVFEKMLTGNLIHNSAIFRKSDFIESGGYNPNMIYGIEDWEFYLSLLKPGYKVVKLNTFHYYYRIKAMSRSVGVNAHKERNDAMLLQMFKNHIPLFLEYFNPVRDRIDAETYKKELYWHYHTIDYRIGRMICTPFRVIKNALRKIFSK
jgi:glycosyltransferase involved in cell wall biosynthesis